MSSGQTTKINVKNSRLAVRFVYPAALTFEGPDSDLPRCLLRVRDVGWVQVQPWAYNTIECYGCESCKTFPENVCQFGKLQVRGPC